MSSLIDRIEELKAHSKSDEEIAETLGVGLEDVKILWRGYLDLHADDIALGKKIREAVFESKIQRVVSLIRREQHIQSEAEIGKYLNELSDKEKNALIDRALI